MNKRNEPHPSLGKISAFDNNAVGYDNNSILQYSQGLRLIDTAVDKAIEIIKSKSLNRIDILDVGCGNGITTIKFYIELRRKLVKLFSTIEIYVTGIDISHNMILQSRQNAFYEGISDRFVKFIEKNVEDLFEDNDNFDLIFSNSTLHWCTPNAYKLMFDRLNPGGFIMVHQGGENSYKELHDMVWKAIDKCSLQDYFNGWSIPVFFPNKSDMEQMLKEIGFDNVLVKSYSGPDKQPRVLIDSFAHSPLLLYLERLPDDLSKSELKKTYYELCRELESKDISVNRLYISAKKS